MSESERVADLVEEHGVQRDAANALRRLHPHNPVVDVNAGGELHPRVLVLFPPPLLLLLARLGDQTTRHGIEGVRWRVVVEASLARLVHPPVVVVVVVGEKHSDVDAALLSRPTALEREAREGGGPLGKRPVEYAPDELDAHVLADVAEQRVAQALLVPQEATIVERRALNSQR